MAVVSSVLMDDGAQRMNDDIIRYPDVDTSEIMEIRSSDETRVNDNNKVYVAVGKDLKESQSILRWTLHKHGDRQICLLHVHQPAQKIPMMGTKFRLNQLEAHQVATYHEGERQDMLQLLEKYNQMCQNSGVHVEVQYIEMDSIEKGIVEFILQYNVNWLVMGAAADKQYSRRMVDLKSKKAIYVRLQAAAFCHIQFVCKGNIIFTRQGRLDGLSVSVSSLSLPPNTHSDSGQSSLIPRSHSERENTRLQPDSPTQNYRRVMSDNRGTRITSLPNYNVESTPSSRLNPGLVSNEWSGISQRSPSSGSRISTGSHKVMDGSGPISYALANAVNLSVWVPKQGDESNFIEDIIDTISHRLSSSSSSDSILASHTQWWNHDIFLSFIGENGCKAFVEHIYSSLIQQGIHTYKPEDILSHGDLIGPSILTAIEESRIAIIIFSKNYAGSSRCLDELSYVMKCIDKKELIVMPIFYDVDPSEVREQKGEFGEAFAKQESENTIKVESWRKALADAVNLSGWVPKQGDESNFIEDIIDTISHRLSSSSSSDSILASHTQWWNHDIFLSFIGENGCKAFVKHIYSSLIQQGINTYKPEDILSHGDLIGPSILTAIEESRIAIIIFSKNYAGSSRCLDELSYIMKCIDKKELIVMPIFYDVDPSEVQEQKGEFGEAFAKQELENTIKAESWREALMVACDHSGWSLKHISNGHEGKYINDIVDTISHKLLSLNSNINRDLIGMEPRSKGLKSTLTIGSGGVHMVGVWGLGGGGKTTLASFVYMEISRQFEGRCFVENIRTDSRKYGLKKLQQKILSTILKKEVEVPSVEEGRHMIKRMLCNKSVLIVLDDVDDLNQLHALAGSHDWFGWGSRIIVTTRDQNLLSGNVDVIYGVILLSHDEAYQLLSRHAYGKYQLTEDYEMLSRDVVSYINGLPLALKILGSFLYGKNKKEWSSFLDKLKSLQNPSIIDTLRISYDGLQQEEKELFLDIACFFRHQPKDEAMMILDACYLHPRIGVLIRNALISITGGFFDMHDIVQEMGHYIVRGENPNNPEKHSRVWQEEDVLNICALDAMENNKIQALHAPDYDAPANLLKVVASMKNLRLLNVRQRVKELVEEPLFVSDGLRWISWGKYPASSFPESFQPSKLFGLILKEGSQKELWNGYKHLPSLKVLDLHGSKNLSCTPDFGGLPNLERLVLSSCSSLEEIHPSIGYHGRLVYLNLDGCKKLQKFPDIVAMQKLETLILSGCSELRTFPEIKETMNGLQRLYMDYSGIEVLPASVGQYCTNLVSISLVGCDNLKSIKGNFLLLKQGCSIFC